MQEKGSKSVEADVACFLLRSQAPTHFPPAALALPTGDEKPYCLRGEDGGGGQRVANVVSESDWFGRYGVYLVSELDVVEKASR